MSLRILYGVQATGNGHISRARALGPALASRGCEVTFLFSGREPRALFDMEPFGDFLWRRGLTFVSRRGKLDTLATLRAARPMQLLRDVRALRSELQRFDRIITDYEPVSAWAAKWSGIPAIGIGHQYAFRHPVPKVKLGPVDRTVMTNFAPAGIPVGLHWHHFGCPILPPMAPLDVDADIDAPEREENRILVYLPFETQGAIADLLDRFPQHRFSVFHPEASAHERGSQSWHPTSRTGFHRALLRCSGVICNAGFELVSEVLQIGLKILVKPMQGQPEQQCNALALERLALGSCMQSLDSRAVDAWLETGYPSRIDYPDVAGALADWIADGLNSEVPELARDLWSKTRFPQPLPQGIPEAIDPDYE